MGKNCVKCGTKIPKARLEAINTETCIECSGVVPYSAIQVNVNKSCRTIEVIRDPNRVADLKSGAYRRVFNAKL